MLLSGSIKFLLKQETNWGHHIWTRFAQYSSTKSAEAAIKSLRKNGWSTDTAYPTTDHTVVSVKKWEGVNYPNPRIRCRKVGK